MIAFMISIVLYTNIVIKANAAEQELDISNSQNQSHYELVEINRPIIDVNLF